MKIVRVLEHNKASGTPSFRMGDTIFGSSSWPERIKVLCEDGNIMYWNGYTEKWTDEYDAAGDNHGEIIKSIPEGKR